MKLYISFDLEGISGIVDWEQCTGSSFEYLQGIELTLAEINAAIDGAVQGGVTEIVVNDAHSKMRNLNPAGLHHRASYITGAHKPHYMMEGLDSSFDLIFFLGYHGAISGEPSTLSHTYNPSIFTEISLNGVEVGESGINALVALGYGVPITLISGDLPTKIQAERLIPDIKAVVVKESITRFAALNLHPERAREMLFEASQQTVRSLSNHALPRIDLPATLTMTFLTSDMAEVATWVRGVDRTGLREVQITSDDPIHLYENFVAVSYITRQSGGR
jgi:D-amino peptidase